MAIERYLAELLAAAKSHGASFDRVITIGRQNLDFRDRYIPKLEEQLGFPIRDLVKSGRDNSYAELLFKRLGASEIVAIDHTSYEGCTVEHDMNLPLRDELKGKFDVVCDGGSLEHIFNVPQVLSNCMQMVTKGGLYLSMTPASNLNGHGFYQFSAELFFRSLSKENGFKIIGVAICELNSEGRVYRVSDPKTTGVRALYEGRGAAYIAVAAQREEIVVPFEGGWPQQSDYSDRWIRGGGSFSGKDTSSMNRVKGFLKSVIPASLLQRIQMNGVKQRRRKEMRASFIEIDSLNKLWMEAD